MSLSIKLIPAIALAVALSPMAALAQGAYAAPQKVHASEIMVGSATIDNPTTVYGGVNVNSFRDSIGG
jgi:hypothetical protein